MRQVEARVALANPKRLSPNGITGTWKHDYAGLSASVPWLRTGRGQIRLDVSHDIWHIDCIYVAGTYHAVLRCSSGHPFVIGLQTYNPAAGIRAGIASLGRCRKLDGSDYATTTTPLRHALSDCTRCMALATFSFV